jgi:hypothetical protein
MSDKGSVNYHQLGVASLALAAILLCVASVSGYEQLPKSTGDKLSTNLEDSIMSSINTPKVSFGLTVTSLILVVIGIVAVVMKSKSKTL